MSRFAQPTTVIQKVERVGITCPDCGGKSRVTSTTSKPGEKIRRIRTCIDCGQKLYTFEVIVGSKTVET